MNKYKARLLALWYIAVFLRNHGMAAFVSFAKKEVADGEFGVTYIRAKLDYWNKKRLASNAAKVKRLKEASVKKS